VQLTLDMISQQKRDETKPTGPLTASGENFWTKRCLVSSRLLASRFQGPLCGPGKAWQLLVNDVRCRVDKIGEEASQKLAALETVSDFVKGLEADQKSAKKQLGELTAVVQVFTNQQRALLKGDGRSPTSAALNVTQANAVETFGITVADFGKSKQIAKLRLESTKEVTFAKARLTKIEQELEMYHHEVSKLEAELPGIGRGEAAMESFLQANGVQRQAYFGGAFVGNHVEKLLRNLDKLWIILEETAAQMDREAAVFDQLKIGEDSGERQARGCRVCRNDKEYSKAMAEIKDRVSPYWAHFEVFHHECRKTRLLSAAEVDRLCSAATGLVKGAREAYPKTHVELKLHVIEGHVEKFVRKWRSSGLFLEDAVEHYHALDNSFNRRFSCLHGVRKAQSKHNALAIIRRPDIISRSADRATRRQRHFVTPRAPKSA
jgi:hypothetical protein